jgi:hypothetical protein
MCLGGRGGLQVFSRIVFVYAKQACDHEREGRDDVCFDPALPQRNCPHGIGFGPGYPQGLTPDLAVPSRRDLT